MVKIWGFLLVLVRIRENSLIYVLHFHCHSAFISLSFNFSRVLKLWVLFLRLTTRWWRSFSSVHLKGQAVSFECLLSKWSGYEWIFVCCLWNREFSTHSVLWGKDFYPCTVISLCPYMNLDLPLSVATIKWLDTMDWTCSFYWIFIPTLTVLTHSKLLALSNALKLLLHGCQAYEQELKVWELDSCWRTKWWTQTDNKLVKWLMSRDTYYPHGNNGHDTESLECLNFLVGDCGLTVK